MRNILAAIITCVVVSGGAGAQSPDDFARLPAFDGIEISADGRRVAATCPTEETQRVCLFDLAGENPVLPVPVGGGVALTDHYFASNSHLVIRTFARAAVPGGEEYDVDRAVVIDIESGEASTLMSNVEWATSTANVVSLNRSDPDSVLVELRFLHENRQQSGSNFDTGARFVSQLYQVDLDSGRGRRLDSSELAYRVVSGEGEVAARVYHDPESQRFRIVAGERGGSTLYEGEHSYEAPAIPGFVDESGLAFIDWSEPGGRFRRLDLETGELSDPFTFDESGNYSPLFDRYGRLYGFTRESDAGVAQRLTDPRLRRDAESLEAAMGQPVFIETFSDDRGVIVFSTSAPGRPPAYYMFNRDTQSVGVLGETYPELSGAALPERTMISYAASDGLEIPAVLTTPAGYDREDGPLPLVVLPHGGPANRDGLEFDWWAQAIAARGYVVLQPNFRGSDGYGEDFRRAGFGEFGGLMIEDILDGARHLQETGVASADGFCLSGASYGGYAALMGGVRAPDEVACVIAFAPVTDPLTMLGDSSRAGDFEAIDWWEEYMGSRFQDAESARAMSPLARSARLTMPTLVIHGASDVVVPVDHSRALASRMGDTANFEYVELEEETHFLDKASSRRLLLERSFALFDQVLPAPAGSGD